MKPFERKTFFDYWELWKVFSQDYCSRILIVGKTFCETFEILNFFDWENFYEKCYSESRNRKHSQVLAISGSPFPLMSLAKPSKLSFPDPKIRNHKVFGHFGVPVSFDFLSNIKQNWSFRDPKMRKHMDFWPFRGPHFL